MNRHTYILITIILFLSVSVIFITGCAEKKKEERVIATINNYKMTVEDFNYESKEMLSVGRAVGEVPVTKREMLDALITKEVLIQEAERENLDKEKDFMKSIELYWEQTLLKNLLSRKSNEIAQKAAVYENEINGYYGKMKNKIKARVIVFFDEKSAQKAMGCSNDILSSWEKAPQKYSISYVVPSKWYILGEDRSLLEYDVFNADVKKNRGIVKINGNWALILIDEVVPNQAGSLASLKNEITNRIRAIKEKEAMEKWIDSLRSKSRIKVYEKEFDSLN